MSCLAVVVVKWSACSSSTPMIRVRIPLKPTVVSVKCVFEKNEDKQNSKRDWHIFLKKELHASINCKWSITTADHFFPYPLLSLFFKWATHGPFFFIFVFSIQLTVKCSICRWIRDHYLRGPNTNKCFFVKKTNRIDGSSGLGSGCGCGRRLVFKRLWVQIPALHTWWTFSH